ncbi:Reverse transcriptase [Phytophthora palmivora]|uniref:Reverse transcriptase n=1 Tax=Phytophthora palmivora TaxID=4796 RepID=A0A2P4XYH1_9STRA|nr:Reverse transcriptase [Phytophthora palmivora]
MKPCPAPNAEVQEPEVPDSENHGVTLEIRTFAAKVLIAVTRAQVPNNTDPPEDDDEREPLGPLEFQAERWRRIKAHQSHDPYLVELMKFLKGDVGDLPRPRVRKLARVAEDFILDSRDVLYRLSRATRERPRDNVDELRLVVPRVLYSDLLHYAHEDYQGGHQGIKRTFEKLSSEFYWLGMYADVERFVKECPMSITTAQDVAEAYEERVFRNFGASSLIRHDQDPCFMSEVFKCFRELLGSRQ